MFCQLRVWYWSSWFAGILYFMQRKSCRLHAWVAANNVFPDGVPKLLLVWLPWAPGHRCALQHSTGWHGRILAVVSLAGGMVALHRCTRTSSAKTLGIRWDPSLLLCSKVWKDHVFGPAACIAWWLLKFWCKSSFINLVVPVSFGWCQIYEYCGSATFWLIWSSMSFTWFPALRVITWFAQFKLCHLAWKLDSILTIPAIHVCF
jgi:hypothetical protein